MAGTIRDSDWLRQSFLVKYDDRNDPEYERILNRRFDSTTRLKFVDTSPGGNICINPLPQWNSNTDIRVPGRLIGSQGMGRFYSEAIDDHNQIIHMRFGTTEFNSLTTFFTGFYNGEGGLLAKTGRSPDLLYSIGKAAGMIVPILAFRLWFISLAGNVLRFFLQKPSSKFCYLKPAMPAYWSAVQGMVNQIAVNKNIVARVFSEDQKLAEDGETDGKTVNEKLHELMPNVFSDKGGINVYVLANRAQRIARKNYLAQAEIFGDTSNLNIYEKIKFWSGKVFSDTGSSYEKYLERWTNSNQGKVKSLPDEKGEYSKANNDTVDSIKTDDKGVKDPTAYDGFSELFKAELDDGGSFVSFRVNPTGSISESFSNSTAPSELQNKFNSTSAGGRNMMFNFAGGNVGELGGLGTALGALMGGVQSVVTGALDGIGASGLMALMGSAFVDMPEHWQSAAARLPTSTYTFRLTSPYAGNPIAQLLHMYLPLSMLLAGAIPIATGKQSYTSPFMLELYDRGRCQTRYGIIDSLTITRGVSNLSFNTEGEPLAIDVSFSFKDLSSIVAMPISNGFSLNIAKGLIDDDNAFTDYMNILGSVSLSDQIYSWKKFKKNLTTYMKNAETFFSVGHIASWAAGTTPGRLASIVYRGVERDGPPQSKNLF